MLRLAKQGVRERYTVTDDDTAHEIDTLYGHGSWKDASTFIDGDEVRFVGVNSNDRFEVRRAGVATARARSEIEQVKWSTWTVDWADGTLRLQKRKRRVYDVEVNGIEEAATVQLVGFAGRRFETDLPSSIPVEVRLLAMVIPMSFWIMQASN